MISGDARIEAEVALVKPKDPSGSYCSKARAFGLTV